jgi:hypothetical protein
VIRPIAGERFTVAVAIPLSTGHAVQNTRTN